MNNLTISKYFFSLVIAWAPVFLFGQSQLERQFFIRPGIDLSRFAMNLVNERQHKSFEANIDCELKYRFFPVIEAGMHSLKDNTESYQYKSEGNYIRIGLNYNMLNYRQRFDRNIFFIGFRYAYSAYNYQAPNITIENAWGLYQNSFEAINSDLQWFEAVVGMRGEIFKNIYLGYTLRVKQKIQKNPFDQFAPYWIPGFGKEAQTRVMGMSYSISYAIPIKNPKPDFKK